MPSSSEQANSILVFPRVVTRCFRLVFLVLKNDTDTGLTVPRGAVKKSEARHSGNSVAWYIHQTRYRLFSRKRALMGDEIKNTNNQVGRSSTGKFHVLWRGTLVNGKPGRMREFKTERDGWAYLARCDAAGRLVD